MSPDENSCRIDVLSRAPHCTVGYCAKCRTFHVDLGAISLKLNLLQLQALRMSLSEALDAFGRQREESVMVPLPKSGGPAVH